VIRAPIAGVIGRPREKAKTLVSGRVRVTDDVDYFRMPDDPERNSKMRPSLG